MINKLDFLVAKLTEVFDLLHRGFEVHAIDQEPKSIELITNSFLDSKKLHVYLSALEDWELWPEVDFLFAYHSFPFCTPQSFDSVIKKSLSSISIGGIFAASFFGPEDTWAMENKVVGISVDQLKNKLSDFKILSFEEIKKIGPTALQGDKMWNVLEVVARRHHEYSNS